MATIEFFYDFTSPYTYLASTQIESLAKRVGADFQPKPFVLGAVFKAVGTEKIAASIPARAAAMFKDLKAWSRDYGIPFTFPGQFPVNAIRASRSVLAAPDAETGWRLAERVFRAYWGEGRDISDAGVLSGIISAAGLDPEALLVATENPEIKNRLRANTDDAIARGAFGAPTIFVDDQMFFGNDRLHFVERAARGERLYDSL